MAVSEHSLMGSTQRTSHPDFPLLFSPFRLGTREARNRIVSTSHGTNMAVDSAPTDQLIAYHARKARGGCGTVMMFGSASPTPVMPTPSNHVNIWKDSAIDGLREAARAVKEHGALALCQVLAYGRRGRLHADRIGMGPSDTPSPLFQSVPRVLSIAEIGQLVSDHAAACGRLAACGFDGVDLAFYADQLPDQFWNPAVNHRTDLYGGSLENRMRFSMEVLEAVRAEVGREFIVGIRVSGDDATPYGLAKDELLEIITRLDRTGLVDYLTVTGGTAHSARSLAYNNPSAYYAGATFLELARAVKERVQTPVIVTGRIVTPQQAEDVLRSGAADMVGMTRALIADPELPNKAREGRADEVRICMGSNEGCIDRLYFGFPITCVQNPTIGRDREWAELEPAADPRRVVVVGGGPAGMEAARVAAARGHEVILYEERERLGGAIRFASRFPGWEAYANVVDWLERELARLGVDVRLNAAATIEKTLGEEPEAVVIATGAAPRRPYLPGADLPLTTTVADAISGTVTLGRRCVILDEIGYTPGPKLADHLAELGHEVEILTPQYSLGEEIGLTLRAPLLERLLRGGVLITTLARPLEVTEEGVRLAHVLTDAEWTVPADTVVFSSGGNPRDELHRELLSEGDARSIELHLIGDAYAARHLRHATTDGARVGRLL
jgi:dimethylglycine catabolism A